MVARLDLPVQVSNESNPVAGTLIPYPQNILSPPIFPHLFYHWEEFLQAFQVHALDNTKIAGQLFLPMSGESKFVVLKLITPRGLSCASWNIQVDSRAELAGLDSKLWRKSIFKNSHGFPILATAYNPNSAARFTLNADSTIQADLKEMKNLGIDVLWTQLFPDSFSKDTLPLLTELKYCKKLGIQIIPSFSIDFPSSAQVHNFETLFKKWGSLFYRTTDDKIPVNLFEDSAEEVVDDTSRLKDLGETTQFPNWLKEKYSEISSLNSSWKTSFKDFSEISPSNEQIFQEWSPALSDWDSYRSLVRMERWSQMAQEIRQQHKNVLTGMKPFAVYGLDSTYDENYYSLYGFNWVSAREGLMPEYLFAKNSTRPDFLAYSSIGQSMDIAKIADYALAQKVTPFMLFEFNGTRFLPLSGFSADSERNNTIEKTGWWGLPSIYARDYRTRMALYPQLISAIEHGAIPGLYSWNDNTSFSRISDIQKQELLFYLQALRNK